MLHSPSKICAQRAWFVAMLVVMSAFHSKAAEFQQQFQLDPQGRVIAHTRIDGSQVKYEYEGDHVSRVKYADGLAAEFSYDEMGRCQTLKDWTGVTRYSYPASSSVRIEQPNGLWVQTNYSDLGLPQSITLPPLDNGNQDSWKAEYTYDYLGRLRTIKTPIGNFTWEYDPVSLTATRILPSGVRSVFTFGAGGQVLSIRHSGKQNDLILQFDYHFGPDGRIASEDRIDPTGKDTVTYRYDPAGRLTETAHTNGTSESFAYDRRNNITIAQKLAPGGSEGRELGHYDALDEIRSFASATFQNDAAGNVIARQAGGAMARFSFDEEGRLQSVSGSTSAQYRYNAIGRLVGRIVDGKESPWLCAYTEREMIPLADGQRRFVVAGRALCAATNAHVTYYLEDIRRSVRATVDDAGRIAYLNYSAYGQSPSNSHADVAPGFAGMLFDPQTELLLTPARVYCPALGRFLQRDPSIRLPRHSRISFSRYAYCTNDPVNFRDGTGYDDAATADGRGDQISRDLDEFNRGQSMDLAFDILGWAPGRWADFREAISQTYEYCGLAKDAIDTMRTVNTAPHDPNTAAGVLGFALHLFSKFGPGEILPGAAGSIGAQLELARIIGNGVRERTMQNRAMGLLSLGGGIAPTPATIREDMEEFNGSFHGKAGWGEFEGGWQLTHSADGVFGTRSRSDSYANSTVRNLFTADGSRISGTFHRSESRDESGGNLFNLFDPTTVTTQRISEDHFQVVKGPGMGYDLSQADTQKNLRPTSPDISGYDDSRFAGVDSTKGARRSDLYPFPPDHSTPLLPSSIGGVYLGGAQLADLGDIRGVSYDNKSRRLILISGDAGKDTTLPEWELGDFAVILRSIYLYGGPPWASIDPDPRNIEGNTLIPSFSPGLANTRVGWILFQADRIMKCYSLGKDNLTDKDLVSNVIGYREMLAAGMKKLSPGQRSWHRFWLEPLDVLLLETGDAKALIELPRYEVKIQRMRESAGGKLEPAGWVGNDPSAQPFRDWFTMHYDQIATENAATIKPEFDGYKGAAIAVYPELRRIAAMVAVAEQMKQKHLSPPKWLLEYPAVRYPTPSTTPALDVIRESKPYRLDIHGGTGTDVEFISTPVNKPGTVVESAVSHVDVAGARADELIVHDYRDRDQSFKALVLPSEDASAVGAYRDRAIDLAVKVDSQHLFVLSRSFNSFQAANGDLGNWCLSIPHAQIERSVTKTDDGRFQETAPTAIRIYDGDNNLVEDFKLIGTDKNDKYASLLGHSAARVSVVKTEHQLDVQIDWPDGRAVYFAATGEIQSTRADGVKTQYVYSSDNHLLAEIRLSNGSRDARITFQRDPTGRIISAQSSDNQNVSFSYDGTQLVAVQSTQGSRTDYGYDSRGLPSGKSVDGKRVVDVRCNDRGQITHLTRGDSNISLDIQPGPDGTQIAIYKDPVQSARLTYDLRCRPVRWDSDHDGVWSALYAADGTVKSLSYTDPAGNTTTKVISDGRLIWKRDDVVAATLIKASKDVAMLDLLSLGQRRTVQLGDGGTTDKVSVAPIAGDEPSLTAHVDKAQGRASLSYGNTDLIKMQVDPDGRREEISTPQGDYHVTSSTSILPGVRLLTHVDGPDHSALDYTYVPNKGAMISKAKFTDGASKETATIWLEEGLPVQARDFNGAKTMLEYVPSTSRIRALTDPLNRTLKYEYRSNGSVHIDMDGLQAFDLIYEGNLITIKEQSNVNTLDQSRLYLLFGDPLCCASLR